MGVISDSERAGKSAATFKAASRNVLAPVRVCSSVYCQHVGCLRVARKRRTGKSRTLCAYAHRIQGGPKSSTKLNRHIDALVQDTRRSAIAEGPRDASCQLKSCQLPRNSAETTCTTSPEQIEVMKLEGFSAGQFRSSGAERATLVEFRGDLWRQKTRVPGLSCGVVCVILRFAVLVELRLVTDTDRQTQAHG